MKQNILKIKAQSFHSVKVIWFLALRIGPEPWWSDLWQLLSVLRWGFIPELQSDSFHTDHHRQRILVYLKIWHTSWETDQTLQSVSVRIFSSWRKKNICWTSFRLFQWYLYFKKKYTFANENTEDSVQQDQDNISDTKHKQEVLTGRRGTTEMSSSVWKVLDETQKECSSLNASRRCDSDSDSAVLTPTVSPESGPSHPDTQNNIKSRRGSTISLLHHRLRSRQRVHEVVEVVRVAALVLVDFPLDLFGRVLVIVLLVSGHRLQGQERTGRSVRSKLETFGLVYDRFCKLRQ